MGSNRNRQDFACPHIHDPLHSSQCIHQSTAHPLFPKKHFQVLDTPVLFQCLVPVGFTGPERHSDSDTATLTQTNTRTTVPTGEARFSCNQTPECPDFPLLNDGFITHLIHLLNDGFISKNYNLLCTDTENKRGAAKKTRLKATPQDQRG